MVLPIIGLVLRVAALENIAAACNWNLSTIIITKHKLTTGLAISC